MFPKETKIYVEGDSVDVSNLAENSAVASGSGWGQISEGLVERVESQEDEACVLFKITTTGGHTISCTPDHCFYARIDPSVKCYSVYLQERSSLGFRLGVSFDLIGELTLPSSHSAKFDKKALGEVTDRIWIIENTGSLAEANFIQKFSVYRYGIPDIPFQAKKTDLIDIGNDFTKMIFENIDTPSKAKALLDDSFMFLDSPHVTMRFSDSNAPVSSSIQFTIFGGPERPDGRGFSNLIQISGAKEQNLKGEGEKTVRRRKSIHGNWQLEITRDDLDEAELFVKTLSHLDNLEVIKKIQISKNHSYYVLPVSHVKRGMSVPIVNNKGKIEEDSVCSIEIEDYEGPLYLPRISDYRNLIANGFFVGA